MDAPGAAEPMNLCDEMDEAKMATQLQMRCQGSVYHPKQNINNDYSGSLCRWKCFPAVLDKRKYSSNGRKRINFSAVETSHFCSKRLENLPQITAMILRFRLGKESYQSGGIGPMEFDFYHRLWPAAKVAAWMLCFPLGQLKT